MYLLIISRLILTSLVKLCVCMNTCSSVTNDRQEQLMMDKRVRLAFFLCRGSAALKLSCSYGSRAETIPGSWSSFQQIVPFYLL